MLNKWLFTHIDNSALIVFRIIFGALITLEAVGAIFTGWIHRSLIEPEFTFNFIGFDFLQPLPGNGMIWYYAIMGLFGIMVMLGYKYRISILCYTLMWTGVYLMQKSSYNNHYYLLMLLCFLMFLLPAHRYASIDAKQNPDIKKISMPRWCWLLIVLQMWIVYTYAAIAKLYPDWLDATVPEILMRSKADFWLVGGILQEEWTHYVIAWFGILFDLLIIPLLLIRRTRMVAFVAAIFFHLFNSFIFHIGIFPYLSLALIVFFFPSQKIHRIFLKRKPFYDKKELIIPSYRKPLLIFLGLWFAIQIGLPLRHWFFQDNVLWTEEGHRMSWRMMLRARSGIANYTVVDKATGDSIRINKSDYLTPKQVRSASSKPDIIWQFAQHLKDDYAQRGMDVEVYVDSRISINGRPYKVFIDPTVDLGAEQWKHFSHHDWILPSRLD